MQTNFYCQHANSQQPHRRPRLSGVRDLVLLVFITSFKLDLQLKHPKHFAVERILRQQERIVSSERRQVEKRSQSISSGQKMSPPKRDKFAAMAAKASPPKPQTPTKDSKLASMSSRSPNNKFAAMAAAAASTTSTSSSSPSFRADGKLAAMSLKQQKHQAEQTLENLARRTRRRDHVWEDLAKAEAATIRILKVARDTARILSDRTTSSGDEDDESDSDSDDPMSQLRRLSSEYSETIGNIHGWLSPHCDLIRAYKAPLRINRMYQARVEWRLAEEKRSVLREFLRLDTQDDGSAAVAQNGAAKEEA